MRDLFQVNRNIDDAGAGGAAPVDGAGDQGNDVGAAQVPGWISALPDEYKANEFVKGFQKPGDFVKAALDNKTEHDSLKTRLEGAIFKPGENATPAEIAAYRTAMGIPETPDAYDFPKGEGVEHDPKMTEWARGMFHTANLSTEQAAVISQGWDSFVQELNNAQIASDEENTKIAETALKEEWKADFPKNIKETERGYQAFEKSIPGFDALLKTQVGGVQLGNHPTMLKVFHTIYKAIGDDVSMPPNPGGQGNLGNLDFSSIYKVPNPS